MDEFYCNCNKGYQRGDKFDCTSDGTLTLFRFKIFYLYNCKNNF